MVLIYKGILSTRYDLVLCYNLRMKTIKPKLAYAVVDKDNPKITVNDIYTTTDITIEKHEKIIKVYISPAK